MTFDYPGYDLHFATKEICKDGSDHLFTLIYKFHSPVTKYNYILRAEYHKEDVFAVKFYCKKDRRSEHKYSTIINKGDLGNILITCARVVPLLLKDYPTASFGFIGSPTFDKKSNLVEPITETQRFTVYRGIVMQKFGAQTFQHLEYPEISAYLMLNRQHADLSAKEATIRNMFVSTYDTVHDIGS